MTNPLTRVEEIQRRLEAATEPSSRSAGHPAHENLLWNSYGDLQYLLAQLKKTQDALRVARESVKFYAELDDWGYDHDVDGKCDYGISAREALSSISRILGEET